MISPQGAVGLGFTLTQVAGTAVAGRGVVGETATVAVEFTLEEDELIIGAFPTLAWDAEGGNVLSAVSQFDEFALPHRPEGNRRIAGGSGLSIAPFSRLDSMLHSTFVDVG